MSKLEYLTIHMLLHKKHSFYGQEIETTMSTKMSAIVELAQENQSQMAPSITRDIVLKAKELRDSEQVLNCHLWSYQSGP